MFDLYFVVCVVQKFNKFPNIAEKPFVSDKDLDSFLQSSFDNNGQANKHLSKSFSTKLFSS